MYHWFFIFIFAIILKEECAEHMAVKHKDKEPTKSYLELVEQV